MSDPHEPIGTASEEAAKLFSALSDWAKDATGGSAAGAAAAAAGMASGMAGALEDHLATGAPECTYCPICRTVHAVREASPEIRAHLASAAASLMQAAAGILAHVATPPPPPDGRSPGVEHIDLDDDGQAWPEEEQR